MSRIAFHLTMVLALLLALAACGGPTNPPPTADPIEGPSGEVALNGVGDDQTSFEIRNTSNSVLAWTLTVAYDPDGTNPESGAWFSAAPTAGELAGGESQVLTLTLSPGLESGRYRAVLTIDYGSGSTAFEVVGEVDGDSTPPPASGFTVDISPDTITLKPGQSGSAKVTVASSSGAGVSLEASAPAGLTAELSASSEPGEALLEVSVAAGTTAGVYQVLVEGERDGETETATLEVTVPGGGGGGDPGNGVIRGTVTTINADVPIDPPSGPAAAGLVAPTAERPLFVPDQLLVRYRDEGAPSATLGTQAEAVRQSVRALHGLTPVRFRGAARAEVVRIPAGADVLETARELARDPRILYAEPNWYLWPAALPNDPLLGDEWHLPLVGAPLGWEAKSGAAVTVAVIDTGIDLDHDDLQGRFVSNGYDFCNDSDGDCSERDGNPRPLPGDVHGTHVTGLIAAVGNNGIGIAGVMRSQARILPVKVFPDYPAATTADALADAILWSVGEPVSGVPTNGNPAKILNLSLGTSPTIDTGSTDFATLRDAVEAAQGKGALLIAAAGNFAGSVAGVGYPAAFPGVISVGAVTSDLTRGCTSSFSGDPSVQARHIMAPGGTRSAACPGQSDEYLMSTLPGDDYGLLAGTSQAAPIVTGAAALVWGSQSSPSPASVRDALLDSAYFDASFMSSSEYGVGLLRIDAALGFPGPGDSVAVSADSGDDSAVGSATLDPFGSSSQFVLDNLEAGTYTVEASAVGASRSLDGTVSVVLAESGTRTIGVRISP